MASSFPSRSSSRLRSRQITAAFIKRQRPDRLPLTIQYGPLSVDLSVFEVRVLDGGVVVWHKDLLEKLDGEGALPHAAIPHHHQLVRGQVVAGHGAGRHPRLKGSGEGGKQAGRWLVRHTWRSDRDGKKERGPGEEGKKWGGVTLKRGRSRRGEQDRAAFSSPWRPQAGRHETKNIYIYSSEMK